MKRKHVTEKTKEEIIKSQYFLCNQCKNPFHRDSFQIHHKDKDRSNNSLQNLEAVCFNCHGLVHDRIIKQSDIISVSEFFSNNFKFQVR